MATQTTPLSGTIPDHVPAALVHDCPIAARSVLFENVFETRIAPDHAAKPPIYWSPTVYPNNTGAWVSTEKIDELSRSKPRPIELIDSPRCHLSQISAR